jgi:hypothetical protein
MGGDARNTLAVVGIAATAVVGLAGSTGAWLVARDDRIAQRALARDDRAAERAIAHDERTYSRRAAVYLDTIGYLERAHAALRRYANGARVVYPLPERSLFSRLIAFGSDPAIEAYRSARYTGGRAAVSADGHERRRHGGLVLVPRRLFPSQRFEDARQANREQIDLFEKIVHRELS